MTAMGSRGMAQAARLSLSKAHYLADCLCAIPGVKLRYPGTFFHEFLTDLPQADAVLSALEKEGILGGLPLEGGILWCATEKVTRQAIEHTAQIVREVLAG